MQVHKFGGASIATAEKMRNLLPIIQAAGQPLLLVVSAIGKTTNALEEVVALATSDRKEEARESLAALEKFHMDYARALFPDEELDEVAQVLAPYFTEILWALDDARPDSYDYAYDQMVSVGELLSSRLFHRLLVKEGIRVQWQDIRDVLRTDETYREGKVDWDYTEAQAKKRMAPVLEQGKIVITQGFIGSTDQNTSVTLGREGSDYTAALLAAMLNAEGLIIWKDVEGLQNADPKLFPNTVRIESISYHEVIEMAFYGAQVIHPKTIKPLQNRDIPLYVKCFENQALKGTVIQNEVNSLFYPPLIILKKNQVLVQLTTRDYSFITEDNLSALYKEFYGLNIKVNLIQNAAISFVACIDDDPEKLQTLKQRLAPSYKVLFNEGVELLTIRHYSREVVEQFTRHRYPLLRQETRQTIQLVLK